MAYFEVHGGSGLEVPELEEARGEHGVGVEESPQLVPELGELGIIGQASVVLQVVVQHVGGFGLEQLGDFGILVNHIPQESLLDVGVDAAVSEASVEEGEGQDGHELEPEGGVPEHGEEETGAGQDEDLEVVSNAVPAVPVHLDGGDEAVLEILDVGLEGVVGGGRILGLADICVVVGVLGVGVEAALPLPLPAQVVGVAVGELDLVELDDGPQTAHRVGGRDHQ